MYRTNDLNKLALIKTNDLIKIENIKMGGINLKIVKE